MMTDVVLDEDELALDPVPDSLLFDSDFEPGAGADSTACCSVGGGEEDAVVARALCAPHAAASISAASRHERTLDVRGDRLMRDEDTGWATLRNRLEGAS